MSWGDFDPFFLKCVIWLYCVLIAVIVAALRHLHKRRLYAASTCLLVFIITFMMTVMVFFLYGYNGLSAAVVVLLSIMLLVLTSGAALVGKRAEDGHSILFWLAFVGVTFVVASYFAESYRLVVTGLAAIAAAPVLAYVFSMWDFLVRPAVNKPTDQVQPPPPTART